VMEHFPAALTRAESDQMIASLEGRFEQNGFGLWAVEVRASGEMIGFVGLNVPSFDAHFMPAVEIGLAPFPIGVGPRLRHRGRARVAVVRLRGVGALMRSWR